MIKKEYSNDRHIKLERLVEEHFRLLDLQAELSNIIFQMIMTLNTEDIINEEKAMHNRKIENDIDY